MWSVCVCGAYFSRDGRKRRRKRGRSMGRGKRSNNILLVGGERGGSNKFGVCSKSLLDKLKLEARK